MYKTDSEIEHIAYGVIERSLPKPEWTHAAHFATAVWLLRSPCHDAERDMPDLIKRYNEACGVRNTDTDGYHHTITLASLRAAKKVLNELPDETGLAESVNAVLLSGYGHSDWILEYWSRALLFSVDARRTWVDPDMKTQDFLTGTEENS